MTWGIRGWKARCGWKGCGGRSGDCAVGDTLLGTCRLGGCLSKRESHGEDVIEC